MVEQTAHNGCNVGSTPIELTGQKILKILDVLFINICYYKPPKKSEQDYQHLD